MGVLNASAAQLYYLRQVVIVLFGLAADCRIHDLFWRIRVVDLRCLFNSLQYCIGKGMKDLNKNE